ncbi:MAG TPA: hypothetical protein VIQ30_18400 [Pseudonocardia sp.]
MLRAVQPFHAVVDGVERFVPAHELVQDDDPVVAGREALFEPVDGAAEQPARRKATRGRQ